MEGFSRIEGFSKIEGFFKTEGNNLLLLRVSLSSGGRERLLEARSIGRRADISTSIAGDCFS
jgi:hypothetical protein